MEWSHLKAEERCWDLSAQQKAYLAEQIYMRATQPRSINLSLMKPLLAVAGMVVLLFALLLLWPKKPIEEQIVTLPGSSQAKPGDYVEKPEKEPSGQQNNSILPPVKEESSDGQGDQQSAPEKSEEKTPASEKDAGKEQVQSSSGGTNEPEQEKGMTFAKALPIVQSKVHRQKFNNAPTEEQREALAVYLAKENHLYLQGQINGDITAFKEAESKQYILDLAIFTTESGAGKDLTAGEALKISGKTMSPTKVDKMVLGTTELGTVRSFYPRVISKEIQTSADYLQNLSFNAVTPKGRMRLQIKLSGPLGQTQVEELVKHYLSMEEVVWMELSYQTEEDHSNPTTIHRFWETEKEMPVEEADAIITEKILRRPEEKLSDRERMAFYKVFFTETDQLISYYIEEDRHDTFDIMVKIITGPEYNDLDLQSSFQQFLNEPDVEVHIGKMNEAPAAMNVYTKIDRVYSSDRPDLSWLEDEHEIAHMRNGGRYVSVSLDLNHSNIEERGQYLKQFIKHSLSLDCASAVSVMFIAGARVGKTV